MTRGLKRGEFRVLSLIGLLLVLVGDYLYRSEAFLPKDVLGAFEWGTYGALLSASVLKRLGFLQMSALVVAVLGLVLFRRWGRWLLLAYFVLGFTVSSLSGVSVAFGMQDIIPGLGYHALFVVLVLSYFGPCASYFVGPSHDIAAFVHLYSPRDPTELAVVRSILDASRVTYHIESEGVGALFEGTIVPGIFRRRIMVLRDQLVEARQLIEEMQKGQPNQAL